MDVGVGVGVGVGVDTGTGATAGPEAGAVIPFAGCESCECMREFWSSSSSETKPVHTY